MIHHDEVRHLATGPDIGEAPGGIGLAEFVVVTDGDISALIARVKDVLLAVIGPVAGEWHPDDARSRLPAWFIESCAPEQSAEKVEAWLVWWRGLDVEDQVTASREMRWNVDGWLFWLDPDERQWYWWDAVIEDQNYAKVLVEAVGWPTPFGALEWLLRAAGATLVEAVES